MVVSLKQSKIKRFEHVWDTVHTISQSMVYLQFTKCTETQHYISVAQTKEAIGQLKQEAMKKPSWSSSRAGFYFI